MADEYEVFVRRHQRLNAKQINEVMVALRLGSAEEARIMLLEGTGRRITHVTELYDVELHRILAYIAKEKRRRILPQA